MRRYDMGEFIRAIETFGITDTWLPPPPLISIPKSPLATKEAFQSLRQIWFGGAAVSYENQLPLRAMLHDDARINPVWGMTEVGWVTTSLWPKRRSDNSVGAPLKDYRVRYDIPGNLLVYLLI
jgi:acyl-coenzyme A synthetase/AMP-(fatty) acid ligase